MKLYGRERYPRKFTGTLGKTRDRFAERQAQSRIIAYLGRGADIRCAKEPELGANVKLHNPVII
jgi:hypothetical protein